jgi:hypothetical protein
MNCRYFVNALHVDIQLVDEGWTKAAAARRLNASSKMVANWVGDSARMASGACVIALSASLIARLPYAPTSELCAASAMPASRSPSSSVSPRHRQPRLAKAWDLINSRTWSPASRCTATSVSVRDPPRHQELGRINRIGHHH